MRPCSPGNFLYHSRFCQASLNPNIFPFLLFFFFFLSYGDGKFIIKAPRENLFSWHAIPTFLLDVREKETCSMECWGLDIQAS